MVILFAKPAACFLAGVATAVVAPVVLKNGLVHRAVVGAVEAGIRIKNKVQADFDEIKKEACDNIGCCCEKDGCCQ